MEHSDEKPGIIATPAFGDVKCMVGINGLKEAPSFVFDGYSVRTLSGQPLVWPNKETEQRIISMLTNDISSVFIMEFGPHRKPLAEHKITSAPKTTPKP